MKGMVHIDAKGKQWNFLADVQESTEEFRQLLLRHALYVGYTSMDTINLYCKVYGDSAIIRQIPDCPFCGMFVRGTGRMYFRGEHNHEMGPNGAIRFSRNGLL